MIDDKTTNHVVGEKSLNYMVEEESPNHVADKSLSNQAPAPPTHRLRLFVAGSEPNSAKARTVLARLCARHLQANFEIQVIDVLEDYQAAIADQVMAVPTLFVEAPLGKTVIVGSLSDEEKVLAAFGVGSDGGVSP